MGLYSRLAWLALWGLAATGLAIAKLALTRPVAPQGDSKAFENYLAQILGTAEQPGSTDLANRLGNR